MAFNPFETFSVRSKIGKSVMAVLGIVVMLTFVLSSGAVGSGMDFFDQLGGLFGGNRGKGEVVATAYGDDVRAGELDDVRRQRTAAGEYLGRAVEASYAKWASELDAEAKSGRLSTDVKEVVGRFAALKLKADTEPQAYRMFLAQFAGSQFGGQMQDLFKFLGVWQSAQAKPDSDDKRALDAMIAILVHDLGMSPLYLVPIGNEADRDVLDFIVLLRKADRLGVHYSTDGVKELVQRDTGGRLTEDDYRKIETALRTGSRSGGLSTEFLAQAIANEYRAKVALSAIEGKPVYPEIIKAQRQQALPFLSRLVDLGSVRLPGEPATASAVAGGLTPHEFFEFYKDKCGEHSFAVLRVDARNYLDKVATPPRDDPKYKAELNALFARHRGELPDPSRERPGFKEPRKVKVEYVALDASAPRVAQAAPKMEAAGAFLQATTGVLTGDPMAALVNAARPDAAAGSPLAPAEMAARIVARARVEAAQEPYSTLERFEFHPRDTSLYRPQPIASALGMLSGHPDLTAVVGAAAAVHQQVERLDHQARVPLLIQPVLTPFNPTLANALGMPALALVHTPKAPPEELYLAAARTEAKKDQVRDLFLSDVQQLRDKLRTLAGGGDDPLAGIPGAPKPDKAKLEKGREEAKAHLAAWLKDRGLTPAGNKAPVDQWSVTADPDLKALNEVAKPDPDGSSDLSRKLFPDQQNRFGDDVKPVQPFWFPADPVGASADKPNHLVWLTEETEARAIGNNLENADKIAKQMGQPPVSDRVEAAWKLDKARALAEADAKALADKVREIARAANGNRDAIERQLRDLAAERKLEDFTLGRLALLKFEHGQTPAQQGYQPSTVDKSQVLYPTPNFVEKLLDLRKDPVGAVTVLPDAPRTHFYVACLVEKYEKTVDQFREVFAKANTSGIDRNTLYAQYALPEERGEAITDARLRLHADAGLEVKEALTKRERTDE